MCAHFAVPASSILVTTNKPHPLYAGSSLTLFCQIVLSQAVDVPVLVNITWSRSGDQIPIPGDTRVTESFVPPMGNLLEYGSTLELGYLVAEDTGMYQCSVSVEPMTNMPFAEASLSVNTTYINVTGKEFTLTQALYIQLFVLNCFRSSVEYHYRKCWSPHCRAAVFPSMHSRCICQ